MVAAQNGRNVWAGVGIGAVAGALIGTGMGMAAGVALAVSITASTEATYVSGKISKATNQISPAVMKMREVAAKGRAGEVAANIKKNTQHIDSLTGKANYRIPDGLDENRLILSEIKNYTGTLSYTAQLQDFVLWAQAGYQLTGPLQDVVNRGLIHVFPLILE